MPVYAMTLYPRSAHMMSMAEKVSIAAVYREVKTIRRMLEELSEKGILASLSSEPITKEESKELTQALEDIKRGKFVPLSKIKRG